MPGARYHLDDLKLRLLAGTLDQATQIDQVLAKIDLPVAVELAEAGISYNSRIS
jgi:hypothetical protein